MGSQAEHDELVRQIVIAVSALNVCRVWEQPTGGAYRNGRLIKYGLVGCADISGIMFGSGKRIEMEVKTGKAKRTQRQINFARTITDANGLYCLARSLVDAIEFIKSQAAPS